MRDTNVYKKELSPVVEGVLAIICGTVAIGLPFLIWAEQWVTL